jgi:hypothetical protein
MYLYDITHPQRYKKFIRHIEPKGSMGRCADEPLTEPKKKLRGGGQKKITASGFFGVLF